MAMLKMPHSVAVDVMQSDTDNDVEDRWMESSIDHDHVSVDAKIERLSTSAHCGAFALSVES